MPFASGQVEERKKKGKFSLQRLHTARTRDAVFYFSFHLTEFFLFFPPSRDKSKYGEKSREWEQWILPNCNKANLFNSPKFTPPFFTPPNLFIKHKRSFVIENQKSFVFISIEIFNRRSRSILRPVSISPVIRTTASILSSFPSVRVFIARYRGHRSLIRDAIRIALHFRVR